MKARLKGFVRQYAAEYMEKNIIPELKKEQQAVQGIAANVQSMATEMQRVAKRNYISSLNIKNIMSCLAQDRIRNISVRPMIDAPVKIGLTSKITTQEDLESDWSRYWTKELKANFRYNRKRWEFAFVLQALFENDMFGKSGLGFACGNESLPSYLISRGCTITAGDKPLDEEDGGQKKWRSTGEYTESKELLFKQALVSREAFDAAFQLKYLDMNAIPDDSEATYDFIWSVCAIEHLGSIDNGLKFLCESLKLLKPGGISVHTTEYNLFSDDLTIESPDLSFFRKKDFQRLRELLENKAELLDIDYALGDLPFDRYIDMSPYSPQDLSEAPFTGLEIPHDNRTPHLRLLQAGFPITCMGLILKKL
ncbi:MAG: class I SAM-dependent methyltransferase [Desulfovibrio sp.]|uniref:hypothetical protein n=1 Tax=Desulfovibrio sp. TaxID=885 RepID=UPI001A788719|nr:hypothetical protein [Desulfovibrio sp.]MBD5417793.1 class I SAM-dependent methyltransferase [Desulfovibrio sp.]